MSRTILDLTCTCLAGRNKLEVIIPLNRLELRAQLLRASCHCDPSISEKGFFGAGFPTSCLTSSLQPADAQELHVKRPELQPLADFDFVPVKN